MTTLKRITLHNIDAPIDIWTEIAPNIKLLTKQSKSIIESNTEIFTYSEDASNLRKLEARLGRTPNRYNAPSIYFCEITNGFISPRLHKLPRYWIIGTDEHFIDDFLVSTWKDKIPSGVRLTETGDSDTIEIEFNKTLHFNNPIIFMNIFMNTNHLLHESLPNLLYLQELIDDNPDYLIISSAINQNTKNFLLEIGFPVHNIIETSKNTITAPKIIISCFHSHGHLNTPTSALNKTVSLVRDAIETSHSPQYPATRIFVSRSDASQRKLLNEEEISNYLVESHGFTVVTPGQMSLSKQIQYFANASIVVGPHGMGINNFAFASAPKLLLELFQPCWVREAYCRQAQIKGAKYAAYIGKSVDGNLAIDIDSFTLFFEMCLSSLNVN